MDRNLMSDHQKRVAEFMEKAGQNIPDTPLVPSEDVLRLRLNLLLEEFLETVEASGFILTADGIDLHEEPRWILEKTHAPDLIEMVDGIADISVVNVGFLVACGVADKPILEAVDASNLDKFGPGSRRADNGKWIKPPGHKAPDFEACLLEQGYASNPVEEQKTLFDEPIESETRK